MSTGIVQGKHALGPRVERGEGVCVCTSLPFGFEQFGYGGSDPSLVQMKTKTFSIPKMKIENGKNADIVRAKYLWQPIKIRFMS